MTHTHLMSDRSTRTLRIAGWSLAALLLTLPAVAMQAGVEGVVWTASDFVFAAVIFAVVGGLFELAARASRNISYRAAVVVAVANGFLQLWVTLAVGIIGNENDPANWTYLAVVLTGLCTAVTAVGNIRSLARGMAVMAGLQLFFFALHMIDGHMTAVIDLFFTALWLLASRLFALAGRQSEAAA